MAGRKNKTTVDYFPHYCDNGSKTMFILENKFGLTGYAVWYKTLEMLGRSSLHYIDLRNDTDKLFLISKLGITEQVFTEIYDLLAKLNAIDLDLWKHKVVYSDNFISNVEDVYARRNGINVLRKYDLCKHLSIKYTQKTPNKSKVKESKENKSKVIPTFEEFKHHADSKGLNVNQTKLKLKYDSWIENNWVDGKGKKITGWKSKLTNTLPYLLNDEQNNSHQLKPQF